MKKILSIITVFMLLGTFAPKALAQLFTAVTPSGHTLSCYLSSNQVIVNGSSGTLTGYLVIPDSVTYNGNTYPVVSIRNNAFEGCSGLTGVLILNQVTSIYQHAFKNCTSLGYVYIGSAVKYIGSGAFAYCSNLTTIEFNAVNCTTMTANGGELAFYNCINVTTINIGNNVKRIPDYAFKACGIIASPAPGLTTITIPSSVKRIGNEAFGECTRLKTVNFNADSCITMGSLDNFVFDGCTNLATLNIGSNVRSIPTNAFRGCSGLRNVVSEAVNPPTAYSFSFGGLPSNCTLTVPCGSLQYYNATSPWNTFPQINEDCLEYTVTVASADPTMGTVSGGGTYDAGATATLTATPNSGYRFVRWQDNNTQNPRTVTVTVNATYTATFEAIPPTQYTITVGSNNNSWGSVSGGGTYNSGATATLTATPNSGYRFVRWQDNNTQNPRTVTVTANATYTATFEAIPPTQYTITVTSANPTMGTVSGGGTYNVGATATLTATANSGYHFTQWQDGNTQNPRTITVTGNATYTASFAQDANNPCVITTFPYNESFEGDLSCWSAIDGNSDGYTWNSGGLNDISAHSGNTMLVSTSWNNIPLHADEYLISPQIVLPSGAHVTLSWWFIVNGSYPEDKYAVLVSTIGTNVADFSTTLVDITPNAANGSWTQRTLDISSYAGQSIYIAFHHHDTYDQNYIAIDDISITTTAVPTQYTVTVNSANPSMGSVNGGGTYNAGATATLTASANSGYHFVRWSDNNTQNPRNITVNSNITLTAYFAANVGIDDVDNAGIIVYAKDYQIYIDEAFGEEVTVYTIDGRIITSLPKASERVEIPVTTTGVYIVKIGDHPARKVVVIR